QDLPSRPASKPSVAGDAEVGGWTALKGISLERGQRLGWFRGAGDGLQSSGWSLATSSFLIQGAAQAGPSGLSYPVFKGIMKKGYKVPTPIQREVSVGRGGGDGCCGTPVPGRWRWDGDLGKFTGLKTALILGGDKIIATPGRLVHVAVEMKLKLHTVEYVVFDEADRLGRAGVPKPRGGTGPSGLTEPMLIRLDVESKLSEQLKLAFFHVRGDDKPAVLLHLLRNVVKPQDQTVVFVATKHHTEYLKELLTAQGIRCTHIYSSLDQTARKINIAKFAQGKCPVLLVTDVAARGLDIPMLDNVINFSFPAKAKLFLHRVGRVARAGRSGTAYSLVAPDEMPYVFDLHLFLGRPLVPAGAQEMPAGEPDPVAGIGVVTRCPPGCRCRRLRSLRRVADNAHKQYLRSRPGPSPESIKRAKDLDVSQLGIHPLFSAHFEDTELERLKFVDSIKTYKSKATIFEINATSRTPASTVMRSKRRHDHALIEKYQRGQQEKRAAALKGQGLCPAPPGPEEGEGEEGEEENLQDVFSTVVGQKRKRGRGGEDGSRKKPQQPAQRDEDFYIPYRPKDFESERGLSVGGEGSPFEQQAAGAVLDLMGDENHNLNKSKQLLKWDRKKKRFVGQTGQEDKKKVRTESGRYISSSYKNNLYEKWKQKYKVDERDEDGEDGGGREQFRGKHRRGHGEYLEQAAEPPHHPPPPARGRVRSELKNKQQILKQRKKAAKQRFLQSGGLKRLKARNRQRVQELRQMAFGRRVGAAKKGKLRKRV
uniref:RNA helicase n=1 Tax=Buteo japonicus TaxID=224669 RepID=A0A8C0HPE3_9AVES